jgi:hypothetical protein
MRLRESLIAAVMVAALVAFAGPSIAGVTKVEGGVEFSYEDLGAGSVSLAGNFNNWSMNADQMVQDADGVWRVVMDLAPGDYEYKFVVNGSEWIADPDNPRVVGDYGNSGVTINDKGEPETGAAGVALISNTPASSRVRLDGWYRTTYTTRSDVKRDPRWRLERPAHEIYLMVDPTVTDVASGRVTLHVTTGTGDIREITSDIYSGHITLEGGPFSVTGFYNEDRVQFDDPLETVGHRDLYYTIPDEQIPFGRGAQGLDATTSFWDLDLEATYSNVYDYEVLARYVNPYEYVALNNPDLYDNIGTDLLAARLTRPVGPVTLGATYTSWRNGWWIDWTGTNVSPDINEFRAKHPESQSDWFELADTETWLGIDFEAPVMADLLRARGEVARYGFDSRFDMGNRERVEGENYANGAIDVPVGKTNGWIYRMILDVTPIQPLGVRVSTLWRDIEAMGADELYVAFAQPTWVNMVQGQYTEVGYDGSPLSLNVYGPSPKRSELETELDASFTFGIFDLGLGYDFDDYKWTYTAPLNGAFGPIDTWKETRNRTTGRVNVSLSERVDLGLETEFVWVNYDNPDWKDPSRSQTIASADVGLWPDWKLLGNVRFARYDDFARFDTEVPGELNYGSDSFVAPYAALVYSPRQNVEVRIGYGVNPVNYDDTPVEGWDNGREWYMAKYLFDHSAFDWLDAEQALQDARTIGVMGVITF